MSLDLTREQILSRLLTVYRNYYDIEEIPEESAPEGVPLKAVCHFYERSAKYVLIKNAELWHADSNEHFYVFSVPELTEDLFKACENYAYTQGMDQIDPKPGHMCSYITAAFICDRCTPEALKLLKKCKHYKSFHFSLHGWMDFHTILLQSGASDFPTNRSGKSNAKFMKKIFMKKK